MAPSAMESHHASYVSQDDYVDTDELRTTFALAMSAMYKREVPLYGNLIRIVRTINEEALEQSSNPRITALRYGDVAAERLDLERHGAIRLGTPYELKTVRRIFEVIGMSPVGYYDLSQAGLPMHATCFRPITVLALKRNPFRVFTTLLRPDLLKDEESRDLALNLLEHRNIFSTELLEVLDASDRQGKRMTQDQGKTFVREAMKTFGWRQKAAVSKDVYNKLKEEHPILADIASFQSSHINHLTPRTLDISAAQERMKAEGLDVKERIEGPPSRICPVLLRQTSFLALEEKIMFLKSDNTFENGHHKARFGEIEERGAAVTPAGRILYDQLLDKAMKKISQCSECPDAAEQDRILAESFEQYPDDWNVLRAENLVYFDFRRTTKAEGSSMPVSPSREELISRGILEAVPITYEDFLPLSAAGIFQSNLEKRNRVCSSIRNAFEDRTGYERALGRTVIDIHESYSDAQQASLRRCAVELGIDEECLIG
ncbi:Nn.00g065810.m01.CDS01 [Neocucurbitaria sp. VM-36]